MPEGCSWGPMIFRFSPQEFDCLHAYLTHVVSERGANCAMHHVMDTFSISQSKLAYVRGRHYANGMSHCPDLLSPVLLRIDRIQHTLTAARYHAVSTVALTCDARFVSGFLTHFALLKPMPSPVWR